MNSLASLSLVLLLGANVFNFRMPLPFLSPLADDPPPTEQFTPTPDPSTPTPDQPTPTPGTVTPEITPTPEINPQDLTPTPESSPQQTSPSLMYIYLPVVSTPTPAAFHRSGQTFITWPERTEMQGELYRIYRSNQPITRDTLTQATLVGEVGKGSANFYSNRYHDSESGIWKARYYDRLVVDPGGSPIIPNWGLFAWTVSAQDLGGVNTGVGYYAITINSAGGDETFSSGMVVGPVQETVADPLPVELTPAVNIGDGGHVYLQYMDLHSWNPTFHAPNSTNDFYGLDPNDINLTHALQYAYDYEVFTPPASVCGGSLPDKLPVFFHIHGWRWFTSGAEKGYPSQDRMCAYGIYPIDVTNTWYFGFARNNDYRLNPEPSAGDVILNYTEQRMLRMLYDLMRNPPGPAVDANRVYISGQSMGGTGSLAFAERYPNVFAAAYSSQPITNFRTAGVTTSDWVADASGKWGRPELNLPVQLAAPNGWADRLQKYNNVGVWDWEDLTASALGTGPGILAERKYDDMSLLGFAHGTADTVVLWDPQGKPLYSVFSTGAGRPWGAKVTGDEHQWEYYRGLPPFIADLGNFATYYFRPFWNLQAIKNETVPGLSNLSGNSPTLVKGSYYNQTIMWSSSWNNWDTAPVDTPNLWQISLCQTMINSIHCGSGANQTVTVTPRRIQNFVVTPGAKYKAANCYPGGGCFQDWVITADGHGLLTVPDVRVIGESSYGMGSRLRITPQ